MTAGDLGHILCPVGTTLVLVPAHALAVSVGSAPSLPENTSGDNSAPALHAYMAKWAKP